MKSNFLFPKMLLLSAFFLLTWGFGSAQSMHAFVVIQESAPGSAADKDRVEQELADIARQTGMQLKKYAYDRNDVSIVDRIRGLSVGGDDVILFYYSGHGSNSGDGWPKYSNDAGAYEMTDVHDAMVSKNARLTITMYDCCNIGQTTSSAPSIGTRNIATTYALLFKNTSGQIKVSSADDGNYSFGSPETGGFFTSSFLNAMHQYEPSSEAAQRQIWKNILSKSKRDANGMCQQIGKTPQNPKYEINVRTSSLQILDAPDVIEIGKDGAYNFSSFEEIVAEFKDHPDHKGLTVEKLKKWNKNVRVIKKGILINLVEPKNKSAFE